MQIDPAQHSPLENYKLLTSLVVPRPIAWVSSMNEAGVVNLAPFSFFNAVGGDPLYLLISIGSNDGGPKDTARNILSTHEFVVNMVTEELFGAMNISAADFPSAESELDAAGLHAVPSVKVRPPRVAESRVSMECKLHSTQPLGKNTLVIGEVVMFHVADDLVQQDLHIEGFAPVGRMGSPANYCRSADQFEAPRISYAQWQERNRK